MKKYAHTFERVSDPVHTGPDPYGLHINLKSLKTSMTLKFLIILQNLIKAYDSKNGKSKYDRTLTELDVGTTRIRSRVNGVSETETELGCRPMRLQIRILKTVPNVVERAKSGSRIVPYKN